MFHVSCLLSGLRKMLEEGYNGLGQQVGWEMGVITPSNNMRIHISAKPTTVASVSDPRWERERSSSIFRLWGQDRVRWLSLVQEQNRTAQRIYVRKYVCTDTLSQQTHFNYPTINTQHTLLPARRIVEVMSY
jgi:hypothetical protein